MAGSTSGPPFGDDGMPLKGILEGLEAVTAGTVVDEDGIPDDEGVSDRGRASCDGVRQGGVLVPVAVELDVASVSCAEAGPADRVRGTPGLAAAGSTSGPPLGEDGSSFPNGEPLPS